MILHNLRHRSPRLLENLGSCLMLHKFLLNISLTTHSDIMLLKYDPGEEDEDEEMEEIEESDEDDEDDDTDALDDIQGSLFEVLHDIDEVKSWASYGPIRDRLPIPGLHLSQGGVVGLPLSSMDASRIKQHASQFELKSNPSVDDNDPTCDLDSSQFELRNPAWHTAARMLGLEATRSFDAGLATIQLRGLTLSGPSRPLNLWQEYVRYLLCYRLG